MMLSVPRWPGPPPMNNIETIICLMLLLMAVPDVCRKLGHPALANVIFVLFGLGLGPGLQTDVVTMVTQAGEVGFLLVLFEVGLDIDLPNFANFSPPALCPPVVAAAISVGLGAGPRGGLTLPAGLLAAAALTSCSLSMAYLGWKHYPGLPGAARAYVLQIMIALEVMAILVISVDTSPWPAGLVGSSCSNWPAWR